MDPHANHVSSVDLNPSERTIQLEVERVNQKIFQGYRPTPVRIDGRRISGPMGRRSDQNALASMTSWPPTVPMARHKVVSISSRSDLVEPSSMQELTIPPVW